MADIHPSMQRFYTAAAELWPSPVRQVDIAKALNESSQRVNNWESRGLSKDGALAAQRIMGISATHLLDGAEPVFLRPSQPARISAETMAAAWRLAGLLADQTTGSPALSMPRDAALVAQAINAVIEDQARGASDGQRAGEVSGDREPARAADARPKDKPASGRAA